MKHAAVSVAGLALLACSTARGAAEVGSPAPALEPTEWLNTKGPLAWKDLKGRLVLVEKWRTT
ncbi:MAG: hypothetical protein HY721_30195 [Planctomycetes bacterium]|nr:hypothetical protein [Planctomycetota bacterium]